MANPTELTSIFETLVKEINEAGQSDLLKGSIGSIKDLQAVLKEQDKLIEKTLRAGDEQAAMRIIKNAKKAQEAQVEATNNLRDAKEKLLKLEQEGNTKARDAQLKVIGKINQEINKLAREAKLMQKNAAEFGKGAEYNLQQYSRLLETREERIKELGKTGAFIEEKFSNRFEASVNAFTSGVGDLESFGETFAGSLKSLGGYLQERAGKAAEKAGAGKGSMVFADMLGGLSKTISTLAVVGGSIMALVQLFKFVEGTVIEANKALLDGGVAINDLYVVGMEDTNKNLEQVRNTFRDPSFANAMGIPLEDTIGLVTAFNELNMGIKQFGGGVQGMERMKDAMKSARGFAYGLGISMDEAQQYMAKFAFNTGVAAHDGTVIGRMASDFASIRDMALQSSYSTGNFFKKIESVVEELDNMNLRTKEAGALLIRFGRAVGKSGLDKALQQLFGGFRSEGYLEQMKRNMLTKSDSLVRAVQAESIRVGRTFAETYGERVTRDAQGNETGRSGGEALRFLFEKAGVSNMEELQQKLSTMDAAGQQQLMMQISGTDAQAAGVSGEMKDELIRLMRLARGTRADASAADRQAAQEEMGAGGNIQSRFALIESVVGNRNINDLSVIQKEALGQFGVDKEQLEAFARIQTTMKGSFTEAQRIATDIQRINTLTEEDGVDAETKANMIKIQRQNLEAMGDIGAYIDDEGKLRMKDTNMLITNFSDFLSAQGSRLDEALPEAEHTKTQEEYLSEGVNATTSVFNVLNNTIAGILNDISQGIYNMVSYFFSDKESDTTKRFKQEAMREVEARLNELGDERRTEEEAIKAEKERLHSLSFRLDTMTQSEKDAYEQARTDLATRESNFEELKAREQRSREQLRMIQSTNMKDYEIKSRQDVLNLAGYEAMEAQVARGEVQGEAGEVIKDIRTMYSELNDLGIQNSQTLFDYLKTTPRDEQDERVARFMAEMGIQRRVESEMVGYGEHSGVRTETTLVTQDSEGREVVLAGEVFDSRMYTLFGLIHDGIVKQYTTLEDDTVAQAVAELNEETPRAQREREAREALRATREDEIKLQSEAIIRARKETQEEEVKAVARALNLSQDATPEQIATAFASATDAQKAKLRGLSIGGNQTVSQLMGYTPATPATPVTPNPARDLLITNDGQVWKLDTADQFTPMSGGGYAMSKPGGAIDEYIGSRIGGGGGSFNITVNVNGAQNPAETGRAVVQEIRRAQESLTGRTR